MIKAVIYDIYGTIINQEVGDLENSLSKKEKLLKSFSRLKDKYNLSVSPEKLYGLFTAFIGQDHKEKKKQGKKFPEVKIEEIWRKILDTIGKEYDKGFLFEIAHQHNNFTGSKRLYKKAAKTLKQLKQKGIKIGIISNAQFYTEIDLTELLKEKIDIDSMYDIFDRNLVFYSFKLGVSKPNPKAFRLLKKELEKKGITPQETIYVGNDTLKDIETANKNGFKSCLFENIETKHKKTKETPDFKIKDHKELLKLIKR